ncbi:SusE-like protein [Mucinivorans hirudinis]|uniref:SusE-like protein n=1 Tax=Mucinivorans hirudinis TaxID=1433126 RepID=A0A060R972_9BACT|nr:SusE-like protein [Mucinivorans hirudinis]
MKKIKIFTLMALVVSTLFSCKDNGKEIVEINPDKVAAAQFVDLPTAPVILDENNPDGMAPILFTWSKAQYGYAAAVTYTVQAAAANSEVYSEILQSSLNYNVMTNKALNNKLLGMKIKANEVSNIKLRVISSIGKSYRDTISQVRQIAIRPYKTVIVYPSLGLPGNYQGWSPGNEATRIYSTANNGKYEGWIDFTSSDAIEFKFIDGFEWGKPDKGGPAVTPESNGTINGTLAGGDNIKGVPSGYYRVECNWTGNTFKMTPISTWGLIGSATPGGWDNSTALRYDKATNVWTVDVTLTAGEFKFRANNGWDINLGKSEEDGELSLGGGNLPATAGNYTIKLMLGGAIPMYEMIKK